MATSAEQIQALADAVASWRLQEVRIFPFLSVMGAECCTAPMAVHIQCVPSRRASGPLKAHFSSVAVYCFYVSPQRHVRLSASDRRRLQVYYVLTTIAEEVCKALVVIARSNYPIFRSPLFFLRGGTGGRYSTCLSDMQHWST
jgi:hypothetical protein